MDRMIFVNLPVSDLATSRSFYTGLGFTTDEMFSDDQVTSIVVSETIVVMLLAHERFTTFARTPIADATSTTQVLNALSAESREEVDELFARALAHGGAEYRDTQDEGPMYGRAVTDPDGHVWEFVHYDMSQVS
ncbi:VOC family protein [Cellulomonas sp. P22]|uniref:VOC family protein n=1 Tax=Cellulomonas sp. P22 TaxID=3373189 RepID=UPI0037BBCDA6